MDSVERATAARQLAKELEIGHKLSGIQADGQTDSRKSYEDIRNRRCYCRGIFVEQWRTVKGVQKSKLIFVVCKKQMRKVEVACQLTVPGCYTSLP